MKRLGVGIIVCALGTALAATVFSASLAITRARWESDDRKLELAGTAARRATVTVIDAGTGATLGTVRAEDDGRWALTRERLRATPCSVRATQGSVSVVRAVYGAPTSCGGGTTTRSLTSLAITGPSSVAERAAANYTATARFSDGSSQVVTTTAGWTENSAFASIAGGVLTAAAVTGNQAVTISTSFTSAGVTRSATLAVSILDSATATTLASLAITGPATVAESGTASYTATAMFSDGSTQAVTATAVWSEDSGFGSIAGGVLTTTAVTGNQALTISSSFTSAGVTRSATLQVSIVDSNPPPPPATGSHVGRFTVYEGTKTCLRCHTEQATAFHQSVHYQWKGNASESIGLNSTVAGKMGGINDFCIYPDINWLSKLTTTTGAQVDGGCGRCHTGLGLKPTADASTAQLENIDCLLCHSPEYKRTLNAQLLFEPDTAKMTVSVLQAAVDIRLPSNGTCLNCHTKAGGGDNFKRGDLEEAHRTATPSLDVHMASQASGGAGLSCTGCHTTVGHRIAGRGVDMRERDLVGTTVACANCHQSTPHSDATLNRHTARVDCNVCHVPVFAKSAATDMRRDWSKLGVHNLGTGLYEPDMVLQTNVSPVYKFFNGLSQFYQFGEPATPGSNGRVLMAGPLGSINDPGAKITALKRHEGRQPIDPVTARLLPLKIGIFFQTGDVATAVAQGAAAVGWPYTGHGFAETERYMGVYHEVAPKAQALACSSCHGGTRMDFAALGYTPLATRNGRPLCSSCHSAETGTFTSIHQRHVTQRGYDCSTCHTFSKAL